VRTAGPPGVASSREMDIAFADYLEAKFALDERSFRNEVKRSCLERLRSKPFVRCLDLGTGTGAMVRRLIESGLAASLAITALDCDSHLLALAKQDLAERLKRLGFQVRVEAERIDANDANRTVRVELVRSRLFEFDPPQHAGYELVTAHSFMDLVPLARALSRVSMWLQDGGLFYTTLNYDGHTALLPRYRDPAFERAILTAYDASMERRRVEGEPTGGARCGRRLHALLARSGFDVTAYGRADWNITPLAGRYRGQDADVLRMLLACIYRECASTPAIDAGRLACWCTERSAQLERGELAMTVHHIDLLARRCQRLSAFT
jgi:SAM-dependent methyltransferase